MDASSSQTFARFSGINNLDEAVRLVQEIVGVQHDHIFPLREASNVEIDNTQALSSRSGYTSVKTGTAIHSLWACDDICLYCDGAILYKMETDYAVRALRSDLPPHRRMSYAMFNDRAYYTNEVVIGYVHDGADNALTDPAREFKLPLPAGQFIECFNGCLYVACGNILYISDPLCDYYDTRIGYRIFNSRITMLRAVSNGLYVADDEVYFMTGKMNEDFERTSVYPSRVIPYTDVMVSAQFVGNGGNGDYAMWTCEDGICIGDDNGKVMNLTVAKYALTPTAEGAAFIRQNDNLKFYINTLY